MTDVHSCSYYCDRPECIKAQRDELRDRLAQPEQELVFDCPRCGHCCPPRKLEQETANEFRMSLRDHFAAKAMSIMWDAYDKGYCGLNNNDAPNTEIIAKGAYQMADAMLKAREQ